ncbi:NAD(P)H-binding protein [Mycobacterium sp.]|uniref:NAD(P)H-binding protein n=1 Tax=Mycobacterium sp. TaxID=1785 RepID=UPI002B64C64C|nr:NAD(P)H-binding protein [Mycobacterium sp.]HTY32078.1 NAD(P)H-binding protein [Mycobacterium sp.]
MAEPPTYLITGAGGGVAGISPQVVTRLLRRGEAVRAMVHHDDARADALRAEGAEVIAGDLTNPVDVFAAMSGISRVFFNMSVSPDYLQATTVVCVAAEELGGLEVLVNMSQMTVSQMATTSTEESRQQRLHWLAERVINWSGLPAVHVRPTVLLENPLFDMLAARSIRETGQLSLPFGNGRTSPVASSDVADVVTAVLLAPRDHLGAVYELTGPATLDADELAEQYSHALGRPVTAVRPSAFGGRRRSGSSGATSRLPAKCGRPRRRPSPPR